jgi:MYXO-CTERM domain-containing protein
MGVPRELSVCAPPPPTCAPGGWLERIDVDNPGASCGGAEPRPEQLVPPPAPSCPGLFGCGCRGGGDDAGVLVLLGIGWLAFGRPSTRRLRRLAQDERARPGLPRP